MEEVNELEEQEMSTEDLAENTDDVLNVLIELLIKKGVFTEEEWENALNEEE